MDLIEGTETSANVNQPLGIHPKIETVKGYSNYRWDLTLYRPMLLSGNIKI
jgi:hypothetical protein